jgi:hypothetical protein
MPILVLVFGFKRAGWRSEVVAVVPASNPALQVLEELAEEGGFVLSSHADKT